MSGHNWEPGDVALIKTTANRGVSCAAVRTIDDHWRCQHITTVDADVIEARPLVVIDPEDREQVKRLDDLLWATRTAGEATDDLQAALREFAAPTPPKPDEPMGLGAVVEDADGRIYTRYETTGEPQPWWQSRHGLEHDVVRRFEWDAIAAVRVLSEGVQ